MAPSTIYTLRKFTRRHKAALTTAAAFVTLLVLGSAVAAFQAVQNKAIAGTAKANEIKANRNAAAAVTARKASQEQSFKLAVDRGLALCRQRRVGGSKILTACHDGIARIWDVESREVIARCELPTRPPTADFFDSQGTQIVVADMTGNIYFWDATSNEKHRLAFGIST